MSFGFIQYLRNSERAKWLRRTHPNAYLLLSVIAERARRTTDINDGMPLGGADIGDFKEAGIKTRKMFRTALKILLKESFIEVIETQKNKNQWTGTGSALVHQGATKRATKRATNGTRVKLLDDTVWNINSEDKTKERATKRATEEATVRATEGPPKGHEQERKKERITKSLSNDRDLRSPRQKARGDSDIAPPTARSFAIDLSLRKFIGIDEETKTIWQKKYPLADYDAVLAKAVDYAFEKGDLRLFEEFPRKYITDRLKAANDKQFYTRKSHAAKQSGSTEYADPRPKKYFTVGSNS